MKKEKWVISPLGDARLPGENSQIFVASNTDEAAIDSMFKKVTDPGCSKMSGCKAPEILSREAYFMVR
ncbi:MAG: hypothetical protein NT047_04445 [Deltaproteobacteria bacterium]|nr:hypothetical protein [Deltaproteobacteria bacterium]